MMTAGFLLGTIMGILLGVTLYCEAENWARKRFIEEQEAKARRDGVVEGRIV